MIEARHTTVLCSIEKKISNKVSNLNSVYSGILAKNLICFT